MATDTYGEDPNAFLKMPEPGSPGFPIVPAAPGAAPPTPPPAAQAGQWAPTNQGFLDWSTKTYGTEKPGSAFVDTHGVPFEDVLKRYREETGNRADYLGGPSKDRVDFGQGVQDAWTSGNRIWNDESTGAGGPGGSRPDPRPPSSGGAPPPPDSGVAIPWGSSPEAPPPLPAFAPTPYTPATPYSPPALRGAPSAAKDWTGTTPGQGTDLYNKLLARATQSLAIDPNDPIIRNQSDAFNAQQARARTKYLQETAERGGANSNMGAEQRASAEQAGQAGADFEARLMGQELSARREEIQAALEGARGLLTDQQHLQLQQELARIAQEESRYQFDTGEGARRYEFDTGEGSRRYEFNTGVGQKEKDRAQQESEFVRALLERRGEFGQTLGNTRYQFDTGLGQQESEFARSLGQRGYEFDANDRFRNSPLGG